MNKKGEKATAESRAQARVDVANRLREMAKFMDHGRKPDPKSLLRIAADLLEKV